MRAPVSDAPETRARPGIVSRVDGGARDLRAIARKSATESCSPRAFGSMPARSSVSGCRGRRAAEHARRAPAAASCAAAGTRRRRARRSRRRSCLGARRLARARTRRGSSRRWAPARTPARLTCPAVDQRAVPGGLHARRAVDLRPGRGGDAAARPRPAPSRAPAASDGKCSSRCSSTGTETLYGRFATSAVGSPGSSVTRSASSCDTVSGASGLQLRRPCAAAARRAAGRSRRR